MRGELKMSIRKIITTVIAFCVGFYYTPKNKANPQKEPGADFFDPTFFIGNWQYRDLHNRCHQFVIMPDLSLQIDGRIINASIKSMEPLKITYIDNLGYHLIVFADQNGPCKFYDEANSYNYILQSP